MNTLKNIDHSAAPYVGNLSFAVNTDEIVKALWQIADKPPASMPLPQFVNEIEVRPTPIEVQAPRVENIINVSPTPISFEPKDISVLIETKQIIAAIYLLAGVLFVSAMAICLLLTRLSH